MSSAAGTPGRWQPWPRETIVIEHRPAAAVAWLLQG
jgi:hypothetical protein